MKDYPSGFFYTYLWLREDGIPYYVGKGTGRRAFVSDAHTFKRPKDSSRILVQPHPTEADAFAAEVFLVTYYGRLEDGTGCLRNLTIGGDGVRMTPEIRAKMSAAQMGNQKGKGHKMPAHVKQILSLANQHPKSLEARKNMSIAKKKINYRPSQQCVIARIKALTGRKQSPEQIAKRVANTDYKAIVRTKGTDGRFMRSI